MITSGKVWGSTELIIANNVLELHKIYVKKGGICSKHRHIHKINGFYIIEGILLIRTWKNNYDLVDETMLYDGCFTQINPGEFHQFEGIDESTIAFEIYWTSTIDHNDIERESVGMMKTLKTLDKRPKK